MLTVLHSISDGETNTATPVSIDNDPLQPSDDQARTRATEVQGHLLCPPPQLQQLPLLIRRTEERNRHTC